jgi:dihydrofolate reductase
MRRIVYYVASSVDGFISGQDGDISGSAGGGDGVEQYLADLARFDTVIMGRNTYEFGYAYGLQPGQPAYPHMKHYIFSNTLKLESRSPQVEVKALDIKEIERLQTQEGMDIYLCGGGQFAGWLLDHQKIGILRLKLNPLILGAEVRLFGSSAARYQLALLETSNYEQGLQPMTFQILCP